MAAAGERKFQELGCVTCHRADTEGRGPNLQGLFGRPVTLAGGGTVTADEGYLRESIVNPSAKVVAGYQPIMPAYQGLVTEEGLTHLVAYIAGLGGNPAAQGGAAAAPASTPSAVPAAPEGPRQ
jgi:cytochrome c oxidase subunit 2